MKIDLNTILNKTYENVIADKDNQLFKHHLKLSLQKLVQNFRHWIVESFKLPLQNYKILISAKPSDHKITPKLLRNIFKSFPVNEFLMRNFPHHKTEYDGDLIKKCKRLKCPFCWTSEASQMPASKLTWVGKLFSLIVNYSPTTFNEIPFNILQERTFFLSFQSQIPS